MSTWTIESPNTKYTGTTAGVKFKNGKGVTDDPSVLSWFKRHDYRVSNGGDKLVEPHASVAGSEFTKAPKTLDAAVVGKDAAGPRSDAFLPPIGAGEGKDPHGQEVVSPGIHAVPPAPVVGGEVSADPDVQEAKETEAATAALVDGEPVVDGVDRKAPAETPKAAKAKKGKASK